MIAGFDLGAKCGYALLNDDGTRADSGTWRLGKRSGKSLTLYERNIESILCEGVTAVCYERVRRHRGVEAAHAYGGYQAILWKTCNDLGIPEDWIIEASVQQIKRVATGNSKADKEDVEAAAMGRWARIPEDDNEADALFCAEVVRRRLNGETV